MATLGTILCCLVVADFITGLVHWFEDTYGLPDWPVIGKLIIEPNIEHHLHPGRIGSMGAFIGRNYQPAIPALLVASLAFWLIGFAAWPICLVAFFASMGNEVHTWNHRSNNPWFVRFLQETCIIQTPRQHAKHHHAPYDRHFCTLTNITNEVLEAVNFWRRLERVIQWFGIHPKRLSPARQGV